MNVLKATLFMTVASLSQVSHADAISKTQGALESSNFYMGGGLGTSVFQIDDINGLTESKHDVYDSSGWKAYIGYQWTPTWGIEVGYASLGMISNQYTQGRYRADADSFFITGTARLLQRGQFTLKGKLILASNRLDPYHSNPKVSGFDTLTGSRTDNLNLGLRGEYRLNEQWSASMDVESFGAYSNKVNGQLLTLGAIYHF